MSSFQAAAAALRVELTAPEVAQTIILTRTSGRTPMPPEQELDVLARATRLSVYSCPLTKLAAVAEKLAFHYGPQCRSPWCTGRHGPINRSFGAHLMILPTRPEVRDQQNRDDNRGAALSRDIPVSKLYDPAFSHEYRIGNKS